MLPDFGVSKSLILVSDGRMVDNVSIVLPSGIAVSLNIKSQEADRLVDALARLTGESKTRAVVVALSERLDRERRRRDRKTLSSDLIEIGRRSACHAREENRSHEEFLYDDHGLPR